jgi:peptide/nickel transport system substrate-binding protein
VNVTGVTYLLRSRLVASEGGDGVRRVGGKAATGKPTRQPTGLRRLAPLLALMLFAAACASVASGSTQPSGGDDDDADAGPPQYGGKMTYGIEAETTNGYCLAEGQLAISGIQVARSIYDTLTVPDGDGNFQPFLAESLTPNADYTEWTVQLREGVTFHDGSPLTAEVVKNNIDAWRNQYPGRSSLLLQFVFGDIADTRATGPLTVVITTARPWVALPAALYSSGRVGIMAQSQLDDPDHCADDLIGTGPFKLVDWQVNNRMRLERNEDYWRRDQNGNQLPYLDELEFRPMPEESQRVNALRSGEIDGFHMSSITASLVVDEMRALDEAEQVNMAESDDFAEVGFIMLNLTEPPFNDIRVREALALAVEGELSNEIFSKSIPTPANGPFAPGSMGYVEDTAFQTSDPARARQLVDEYERETGQQLEFTITSQNTTSLLQQLELAKQFWEDVGMTVRITTLEQSALIQAAIEKNYQGITFRNYPGLDPDGMYVWWYDGNTNPVNFPGLADPEVDRLLDAGRETPDPAQRRQIYEDLNRRVNEQHYFFWTTWSIWAVPLNPDYHNVVGAQAPGASEYTGLALGHDMAFIWKEQ